MVDWSVWAGVGMGERLGTIDFLARNGVTPIPVETGLGVLETLTTRATPPAVLVTGRFGPPPTVRLAEPTLPLLRFVERVLVHYPGIELVVETELSHLHDPYLADHLIDGAPLLPGVLGLEAMAQVAVALSGASTEPVVENIEFLRPVVVPADRPQPIRIAALIGEDGRVAVTLRSAETAFEAEHFRASYRFDGGCEAVSEPARPEPGAAWMVSTNGWYGSLFFHGPRFRRVQGYRELHARRCVAEVDLNQHSSWFGRFLPDGLILGDPGALDACIHAVQACIPHERLLPVAVARLELLGWPPEGPLTVEAVERSEQGGEFVYDVEGREVGGRPCVRWVGLRLRRAGALAAPTWPSPLLGPYLERQLDARCPGTDIRVGVAQGPERLARSDKAIGRALNLPVTVRRGTDGRPWLDNGSAVSASHSECATIALAAHHRIGCDVQVVEPRSEAQWWRLLGPGRFDLAQALARESGASIDVSATAVWSAEESLLKAGRPVGEPITIRRCDREWVELAAGVLDVLLLLAQDGTGRPVVIGTATKAPSHVP
jgi:enediyne polyketide synthase